MSPGRLDSLTRFVFDVLSNPVSDVYSVFQLYPWKHLHATPDLEDISHSQFDVASGALVYGRDVLLHLRQGSLPRLFYAHFIDVCYPGFLTFSGLAP